MHSITEVGSNVAAFLGKLWRMVEDPETNDLISWSQSGSSFLIRNQSKFAKELLPRYYKHNNMASFIRQLNMYGFHKIVSPDSGGLKTVNNDEVEFSHTCFVKGHAYLLEHIKRKITKDQTMIRDGNNGNKSDMVNKIMYDVKNMKGRQESFDNKLSTMKQENEALWRELSVLRQKHMKQQQIVNKLINFLVSLVQPSRNGLSVKKFNLPMIKGRKEHTSSICSDDSNFDGNKMQSGPDDRDSSPTGPTIHELDPSDFLDVDLLQNTQGTMLDSPIPEIEHLSSPEGSDVNLISSNTENNPLLLDLVSDVILEDETLVSVPPTEILPSNVEEILGKQEPKKQSNSKKRTRKMCEDNNLLSTETLTGSNLIYKQPKQENSTTKSSCTKNKIAKMINGENGTTFTNDAQMEVGLNADLPVLDVNQIKVERSPESLLLEPEDNDSQFSFSNMNCFAQTPSPSELELACNMSSSPIPTIDTTTNTSKNDCVQLYKTPDTIGRSEFCPPQHFDYHVDSIQTDLDSLKDIMRGEGLSLDANTLLNLFEDAEILSPSALLNPENNSKSFVQNSSDDDGNKLTTYLPSTTIDFSDMFSGNSEPSNNDASESWDTTNVSRPSSTLPSEVDTPINTPLYVLSNSESPLPNKRRRK